MDVRGKRAFVTGTAQGIGRALSIRLARSGCDVIGCDLTIESQADVAGAVEAEGGTYTALAADLADAEAARRVTREAVATGFDLLVNNAGIATSGRYLGADFEVWHRTVRIDLVAVMAVTYEALDHLRSRPAAHIVNLSSIAGVSAAAGTAAYNAAKFGVTGFSRAIELECAGSPVCVSTIHPTMARTRMIDGVTGSRNVPVIEPEEVVDAIMDAVARGRGTVFVPARMRWLMDVLPRLMPGLSRRLTLRDESARSWLEAQKGLPDGDPR